MGRQSGGNMAGLAYDKRGKRVKKRKLEEARDKAKKSGKKVVSLFEQQLAWNRFKATRRIKRTDNEKKV